jgi:hypothetical protein
MLKAMRPLIFAITLMVSCLGVFGNASGQQFSKDQLAFFEQKIRPLLVERCYECHSADAKESKGGLRLDSREGILIGGDSGPAVVEGIPEQSLLVTAVHYRDPAYEMPPSGKLADREIAVLEQWVREGLPFPAVSSVAPTKRVIDIDAGRQHWAFQKLKPSALPPLEQPSTWPQGRIDQFILAEQQKQSLNPALAAPKTKLLRRAKFDLLGIPPTFEEIESFVEDQQPDALERRIDKWLESPEYGERWARPWLELVRYCDTPEEWTEIHHTFRYRDWVIAALNEDMPYDRFAKLQMAADQISDARPTDLAALGFIGLSPTYWKELQLPVEIIKMIVSDEYEERIHTWSSTFLGINVACARCHDHKVEPITVQDYYALAGIFASSRLLDRSLEQGVDSLEVIEARKRVKELEPKIAAQEKELKDLIAKKDAGSLPAEEQPKIEAKQKEFEDLKKTVADAKAVKGFDGPMAPGVMDASLEVLPAIGTHGSRIHYEMAPKNLAIEIRGNPNKTGDLVARRYVSVLSESEPEAFQQGSGRFELAETMFQQSSSLVARVIVNRIWRLHMGRGIVETPSDFGLQGDPPSHPELLEDLTARFIEHSWSLKWLHREIMLSNTYQQDSLVKGEPGQPDKWYVGYPVRRLDVEYWRDAMLVSTGALDRTVGGPPAELSTANNTKRTIYGTVKRRELTDILRLYDFPDPLTHSPGRVATTTPLQQLFVLNSPFMQEQGNALVARLGRDVGDDVPKRIEWAYKLLFGRLPDEKELQIGLQYVSDGKIQSWQTYAQVLLGSNEFIFLD